MSNLLSTLFNPAVNIPTGLGITVASDTTLTVAPGLAMDANYSRNIELTSSVTLNMAVNGINGLDTGSIAASTLYYVYLISPANDATLPNGVIASTSASAPTLPDNYYFKKLIGVALTDGSSHFLKLYQIGDGVIRRYYFDAPITVLNAGTSATYANVDLATYIPLVNTQVILNVSFTPNAAADAASFIPVGSSSSAPTTFTGVVAAKAQDGQLILPATVSSAVVGVQYKVAASGSLTLGLLAFDHSIV